MADLVLVCPAGLWEPPSHGNLTFKPFSDRETGREQLIVVPEWVAPHFHPQRRFLSGQARMAGKTGAVKSGSAGLSPYCRYRRGTALPGSLARRLHRAHAAPRAFFRE
jgi:hypothetical protein